MYHYFEEKIYIKFTILSLHISLILKINKTSKLAIL